MRARMITLGLVVALLGVVAPVGGAAPAEAATPTTVSLGSGGFGSIVVDDARGHVFVSTPYTNSVRVLDLDGNLVTTIAGIPNAWGMVMHGSSLYVVAYSTGDIDEIDLTTLTITRQVATGVGHPWRLAFAGGRLWTAIGRPSTENHQLVSVTLSGVVTTYAYPTYYEADFATSPALPDTLYVLEDGQSPGELHRIDVANSGFTETASAWGVGGNLEDAAVSADGTRLIPAHGGPYEFEEWSADTLTRDGIVYPGSAYPSAVAISPGQGGIVATGLSTHDNAPNIRVFGLGQTTPFFTASTPPSSGVLDVLPHGLALTADGSRLFAVNGDFPYHTSPSLSIFALTPDPRASTTTAVSTAPNPSAPNASVTITATVQPGDAAGSVAFLAAGQPIAGCSAQPLSSDASGATSTCVTTALPEGSSTVTAAYGGDGTHRGSTGTTNHTVLQSFLRRIRAVRTNLDSYVGFNPVPKSTYDHIVNAIGHLDKALNTPGLWNVDERHLTAKGGTVFDEDKAAVDELLKIAAPRPTVVTNAVSELVATDRAIAELQYSDATAQIDSITPTNASEYQKAKFELAAAASELQKGIQDQSNLRWSSAIGHFKSAWQHAMNAAQHAALA